MTDIGNHIILAEYLEDLAKHCRNIGHMRRLESGAAELEQFRERLQRNGESYIGLSMYRRISDMAFVFAGEYQDAIALRDKTNEMSKNIRKLNKQRGLA